MAYINRSYNNDGYNTMNYYGGNCGCSDCLNKGGNKMIPNPDNEYGLPDNTDAHILPYPYEQQMCNCDTCIEGGNFFDELSNMMPDILGNVPIVGSILKPVTKFTLDVLDPYRKNPKNPENQQQGNAYTYVYQKPKSSYNKEQQAILDKMKGKGIRKKKVSFYRPKKGSPEAKAKMAYLRSLRKR